MFERLHQLRTAWRETGWPFWKIAGYLVAKIAFIARQSWLERRRNG